MLFGVSGTLVYIVLTNMDRKGCIQRYVRSMKFGYLKPRGIHRENINRADVARGVPVLLNGTKLKAGNL
jgi:hypothetical protein